jgi:putative hemolysin
MPVLEMAVVLVLVVLNGYFAMSELAVVSARPARLEAQARKGGRGARLALALHHDPGRMLSTVQIGITLVGIVAGAFGGAALAEPLDDALAGLPGLAPFSAEIAYTLVVVAITYLSLIIGELVPKQLALRAPERVAAMVAPAVDLLSRISTPAVWLLETSSRLVLRLLGSEPRSRESVTEEEVRTLIAEGTRTGVFHKAEQEMIGRVLRLADRPVRAIMTPRLERASSRRAATAASWSARAASTTCWAWSMCAACSMTASPAGRSIYAPPCARRWSCTTACPCCARWKRSVRRGSAWRWWSTSMARSRA